MCKEESDNNQENHERDDYIDKLVDEVTPKQVFVVYKKKIENYIEGLKKSLIKLMQKIRRKVI